MAPSRKKRKHKDSSAIGKYPFVSRPVFKVPTRSSGFVHKLRNSTVQASTPNTSMKSDINNTDSTRRSVYEPRGMSALRLDSRPSVRECTSSPSYSASQKALNTKKQSASPAPAVNDKIATEKSHHRSTQIASLDIASLDRLPILKHERFSSSSSSPSSSSSTSSSSSSDDDDDSSDDDGNNVSVPTRSPKSLKPFKSTTGISTVASRNPLPREFLERFSITGTNSTHSHHKNALPHRAHADTTAAAKPATSAQPATITDSVYPSSVLMAARALESILPPPYYLSMSKKDNKITKHDTPKYSRPRNASPPPSLADHPDTSRLIMLLESSRKLIMHISTKKVSDHNNGLVMQAELLRIAEQRKATIKILEAEVRRLRIVAGQMDVE